jgi:hypothetical protein
MVPNGNAYNCDGGFSFGFQAIVFGASVGFPVSNDECQVLLDAAVLRDMGHEEAACHYVMANNERMGIAMKRAGVICGQAAVHTTYVYPRSNPAAVDVDKLDALLDFATEDGMSK